jgi:hypothetical protein
VRILFGEGLSYPSSARVNGCLENLMFTSAYMCSVSQHWFHVLELTGRERFDFSNGVGILRTVLCFVGRVITSEFDFIGHGGTTTFGKVLEWWRES